MLILSRNTDKPIQTVKHLEENIEMNGRYALDFPDCVRLDRYDGTPSEIVTREVEPKFLTHYPTYDHVYYNPIISGHNLSDGISSYDFIDPSKNFPFETGQTISRYKIGLTPNTFSVLPVNGNTSWNGVAITKQIDITSLTSDGEGKETFLLYWRAVRKVISHDQTPIGGSYPNINNTPSKMTYVEAVEDSQYSVYISSNDGNTFKLAKRLVPFSFNEKAENIRIAFVNKHSEDIYFLSYALMF